MPARPWVLLAAAALCACQQKPPQPDPADVQAARQAAAQLDVRFRTELVDRLERETPLAIYLAYREHAAQFVADAQKKSGLEIRRIGLRVRNPSNKADDWEADQLEKIDALVSAGYDVNWLEISAIVTEGKTRWFRWLKPIPMDETCMACHGDNVPPEILKELKQDYSEDEAVGFLPYEMRGAYAVRRKLE